MHLFLSPHYDDAVFSSGGLIRRLVVSGAPVVVRTVMGGKPSPQNLPDTPLVRELHARWGAGDDPVAARLREDEKAVTSLGAKADRMVYWMDCIYRVSRRGEALYTTQDSLFGEVHPDDVAGQLLSTLVLPPREFVRAIYVPLGAGHHVDHQLVRDWGMELRKQYSWVALNFYEEYPYLQKQGAVERAIEYFATLEPPLGLEAEIVRLDEADVTAKLAAMAWYQSQVKSAWTDKTAMETAVRTSLNQTGNGEPAERLWRITT